jgi:membrane-associated phospholipid phosphatase
VKAGTRGSWHRAAFALAVFASPLTAHGQDAADAGAPAPALPVGNAGPEVNKVEKKVEKEKKEAQLTPIVTNPHDVSKPAYQLFAQTDIPLLGIGIVLASARLVRTQPAYCAPECNPADLNPLDRTTAGFWNVGWSTASDIGLYSLMGFSALVLLVDEGPLPALNDAVVVAESGLLATAFSSVVTVAAGRPRPFLYGTKAPLDERNSADGGLSFLSSHATVSFAVVTSMYLTERRLHPDESLPYLVLGGGLVLSSFIGTARVMAGRHFITDSIGGAIMGTSVGILVPALHGLPVQVLPQVTPKDASITVVRVF